jgi:hypothetical protein
MDKNITPLNGHVSEETAYVVEDYPYGFKLRCTIKFWLEYNAKKGYRFCSMTKNPNNGVWNAAKKSTYSLGVANMYLDSNNHVAWSAVTGNDGYEAIYKFVRRFPQNKANKRFMMTCEARIAYCDRVLAGKPTFSINNVPREQTEEDKIRAYWDKACWVYLKNYIDLAG